MTGANALDRNFARIVEQFDAREVSFVSVTQSFNTTSSMGRLTLNVLLSFAQFEREVTGERIRDKIAASKAKGMWMGGVLPLGYDLPKEGSRTLEVNDAEAATVRAIYQRYLELGSVHQLAVDLEKRSIVSKARTARSGKMLGGIAFSRGALFHLLRNPVYLGKITHGTLVHQGAHAPILGEELFLQVQARLDAQKRRHERCGERRVQSAPLTGRLFGPGSKPLTPSFSRGKSGRVYRYYVSAALQQGAKAGDAQLLRVSAAKLERFVRAALERLLPLQAEPLGSIKRLAIEHGRVELKLPASLFRDLQARVALGEDVIRIDRESCVLVLPAVFSNRSSDTSIVSGMPPTAEPDRTLITALRKAHRMLERDGSGMPILAAAPKSPYERRLLRLAFLAPDIQRDILAGRHSARLNLERLMQFQIPLDWAAQRAMFGLS